MRGFHPGDEVAVRTADNRWIRKTVVAAGGRDFPCWNVRWADDLDDEWMPWPIEDVVAISDQPGALTRAEYVESLAYPGTAAVRVRGNTR